MIYYKKPALVIFISILIIIGLFLIYSPNKKIEIWNKNSSNDNSTTVNKKDIQLSVAKTTGNQFFPPDIEPQKQLSNPPKVVKAIYLTSWSGGNESKIQQVISLAKVGKINAVVIDIKDFSGKVAYNTSVEEAEKYGAEEFRISRINSLIKRLHDENIYVIARQVVFQDPVLAAARPELAVKSIKLSESATASDDLWRDYKGLAWIDPAASASWDYNVKIAKDAWGRGFDEINFDYIRFPTDGDLPDRLFPVWDGKRLMTSVMRDFYKEIRLDMPEARLSIDLFGLAATSFYDFGVGQMIEDAFEYFDFVSPMLYPSHFPETFLDPPGGEIRKPAEYPYEVVRQSMDTAIVRLTNYKTTKAALRPWLQDFDLGADYDAEKVKAQIQAVIDSSGGEESEQYRGFMLWNPANIYTEEAL